MARWRSGPRTRTRCSSSATSSSHWMRSRRLPPMPEIDESGQVVAISNVRGPDLPSTAYFRLSENGNWYELSERMSGGMSTAEIFRLGDVTLLIPQSKIVRDGAASMPESAVDAPAAEIGGSGSTETAEMISGRRTDAPDRHSMAAAMDLESSATPERDLAL